MISKEKYSLRGHGVGITDGMSFLKYVAEMTSGGMIYIPSFVIIHLSIQMILFLNYLRGCSVGITDGRDLRSTLLRWPEVAYTYQLL
jgi:hypothetical protein